MSESNSFHPTDRIPDADPLNEGGLRAPPGLSPLRKIWWWFDFIILVKLARLRFIAVLLAVGGLIAYWDTIKAHYDKWVRPSPAQAVAASDIEFWCPMHPTVVRDKPDKCPICAMPLSKRKKGDHAEDEPLPAGVVSRVQLTPYRVALAGIETTEIGYRSLTKDIQTVGYVEFDERRLARISSRVTGKSRIDKLYVNYTGQIVQKGEPLALLYSPDLVVTVQNLLDARRSGNRDLERIAHDRLQLWGIEDDQVQQILKTGRPITHVTIRAPLAGHVIKKYPVEGEYVEEGARLYDVADLSTVWIEGQVYEDEVAFLHEGLPVSATTKAHPNRTFEGTVSFLHPHLDAATRTLRVRFDMENRSHDLRPGMFAAVKVRVPVTRLGTYRNVIFDEWRGQLAADLAWHGIANPSGVSADAGLTALLHAATRRAVVQHGLVLAVPERAVIDTGSRKIVYREAEPNVYEGVQVHLGPRSGGYYPVLDGLEAGSRVATSGSFLIDAETRLTTGAGSTYFGASGGPSADHRAANAARPSMTEDDESKVKGALARLNATDRKLAEVQGYCPVLPQNRLGSMGVPVKVVLDGKPVFLCCKGCIKAAKGNAKKTLAKLAEIGERPRGAPQPMTETPRERMSMRKHKDPEIEAALAKLNAADRKLAEAQGFCPVMPKNELGSMDVPVKVMLNGTPVFLCCEGCIAKAKAKPEQTLKIVEKLKAGKKP